MRADGQQLVYNKTALDTEMPYTAMLNNNIGLYNHPSPPADTQIHTSH